MILKRKKIWWLDHTINGRRIRESLSTTSKRDAQKLAEIRIAEILEHPSAVEKKQENYTFAALFALWEDRVLPFRKSPVNAQEKFWLEHFGDRPVIDIRRDEIERVLSTLSNRRGYGKKKVTPATRNRYLAAIRSLLNYAYKWEWIDAVPRLPAIVAEKNSRNTWATKEQAAQLIARLESGCRETALAARFALATGLRAANVFGMLESEINLATRTAVVPEEKFKGGRTHIVPLNAEAIAVIRELNPAPGARLFTRKEPMKKLWYKALKECGLEGFRWHDLRHTWASWHVQAGTSLPELQALGGWSDFKMVQRYAHLDQHALSSVADNISFSVAA